MKVTIITVCFNAFEDLKKTLNSVLNQTYTDYEYIVIDGGSYDRTLELLKQYKSLFTSAGKSFHFVSEKDNGTYDAMNKGARMAQGEWINYMNAGDSFYATTTLQEFFSHRIANNIGVVYGDTLQIFDFGSGIAKASDYIKDNPTMPFCHQSCFVRTKIMQQYLFDLTYRIVADHDLFFRLSENHVEFQYLPIVVARYNGQYGLSATNPLKLRLERLQIHHVTKKWYYPIALIWTYLRYGWIQTFKNHMPRWMTDAWMKYKRRKFIK